MHTVWFTLLHHRLTFATTAVVYCYKSWKMSPKHSNSGVGTVATCYGFGHTSFSPYNAKYSWAVSCLLQFWTCYTRTLLLYAPPPSHLRWWSQHIIMHGTILQWNWKVRGTGCWSRSIATAPSQRCSLSSLMWWFKNGRCGVNLGGGVLTYKVTLNYALHAL